jgi:hypothetical protein
MLEKIRVKGETMIPKDHTDQLGEFNEIMKTYFIVGYRNKVVNKSDKITAS